MEILKQSKEEKRMASPPKLFDQNSILIVCTVAGAIGPLTVRSLIVSVPSIVRSR